MLLNNLTKQTVDVHWMEKRIFLLSGIFLGKQGIMELKQGVIL